MPRVDAFGSRQFLMSIRPDLCTIPSAYKTSSPVHGSHAYRPRALDVGAGIGRVTADVLLPLFADVVLQEPVENFIGEAFSRGQASEKLASSCDQDGYPIGWPGISTKSKSVSLFQCPLQIFDPSRPHSLDAKFLGRVGFSPQEDDGESGFDVIWCQWCLGHLNDPDLVDFLRRSKKALRNKDALIIVKENLCSEKDGTPRTVFDDDDSSLTRSDLAFKKLFRNADLTIVRELVQKGLPDGIYPVKMFALR